MKSMLIAKSMQNSVQYASANAEQAAHIMYMYIHVWGMKYKISELYSAQYTEVVTSNHMEL